MDAISYGLPSEHFVDPAKHDLERAQVFCNDWVCIGHVERIPNRGDYFTCSVMDEQLLVVRDEDGEIQVRFNVCRHRGCMLLPGASSGKLKNRIVCPYHSWAYDLKGTLVAAPHTKNLDGFRAADFPLIQPRHGVRGGLIFVHLGDRPESIDEHLGGLQPTLQRRRFDELRCAQRLSYVVKANWKVIVYNGNECLHCMTIHPEFHRVAPAGTKSDVLQRDGSFMGSFQELEERFTTLTATGVSRRRMLPGQGDDDLRRCYFYTVFPNLFLNLFPDYAVLLHIWPISVDQSSVLVEFYFHPDQMSEPGFDTADAVQMWKTTYEQDWPICEMVNAGLRSKRGSLPGPYLRDEGLLLEFDRYLLARLDP